MSNEERTIKKAVERTNAVVKRARSLQDELSRLVEEVGAIRHEFDVYFACKAATKDPNPRGDEDG